MKSGIRNPLSANKSMDAELESNGTLVSSGSAGSLTIWHESLAAAQRASAESGKPILADFTGSDWCGWCVKLREDVFETAQFKAWARDNVVLLELDYPKHGRQSAEIKAQNQTLAKRYQVESYPTVLIIDADGSVLGKTGYEKSPSAWIAKAESQMLQSASVAAAQ